jgi:hypothetical protein
MYECCLRSHVFGNICMFWFIDDTHQNSDHFVLFPQSTEQCQHWSCIAADNWTFTPHFCFLLHWEYGAKKVAAVLQNHVVYVFDTKRGCLYHMQQVTYTSKQNAGPRGRLLGSRSDHVYAGQFTPFRRVVTMIMSTMLQHCWTEKFAHQSKSASVQGQRADWWTTFHSGGMIFISASGQLQSVSPPPLTECGNR